MKPGIQTTEFWVTLIITTVAVIALALVLLGIFPDADPRAVPILAALAGISGTGYTVGRSWVKARETESEPWEWVDESEPPST